MSLTLKTEGDFEQLAKGQYEAVCFRIVDMGTTEQQYKDGLWLKEKGAHQFWSARAKDEWRQTI